MKIFISHSSSFNFISELYKPIRESQLTKNHKIFFPHDKKVIHTKQIIKKSDIFILEASYQSTGSGIEAGWANAYKVPIICIYKKGTKPSASLKNISKTFIKYNDTKDLISKLINKI